jgi:phage protein U
MLCSLGPIAFDVTPFSVVQTEELSSADYARKDVVGAAPGHEHVGDGEGTVRLSARLFPERFGGLDSLDALDRVRRSGVAQMMVRGDGKVIGFVLVTEVRAQSQFLDGEGVGRMIEVELTLTRAAQPSPASAFAQLFGLFS